MKLKKSLMKKSILIDATTPKRLFSDNKKRRHAQNLVQRGECGSEEDHPLREGYSTPPPMWRVPMNEQYIKNNTVFTRATYVSSLEVNLDQIGRNKIPSVGDKDVLRASYVHWSGAQVYTTIKEDDGVEQTREVLFIPDSTFLRSVCTSTVHPGKVGGGQFGSGDGMCHPRGQGGGSATNNPMIMAQQTISAARAKRNGGGVRGGESLFVEWIVVRDRKGRVERIPNEFLQCNSFRYLHFDGFVSVTSIGNGFLRGNLRLENIVFPPSLSSVTEIDYDFLLGCGSLVSVDLRGLTGVTTIGPNFLGGCELLASIDIRPFRNLSPINPFSMRCFLWGCDSLRKINLFRCQSWIFDSKESPAHRSNMSIKTQMSFLVFDEAT